MADTTANSSSTAPPPPSSDPTQAPAPAGGKTDSTYVPPPGRLGNLSIPQNHALEKFRTQLKEDGLYVEERMDDATLLRFLRARKWDVPLAKKMLAEAEQWRKDFGVDEIYKNFDYKERVEVDKYYPQYYHRTDKEGRPVYVERLGNINVAELRKITTPERQLKALVLEYERFLKERLPACSLAAGHPIETSCTILDLKGVGLKAFWSVKDYVQDASRVGQNYYPETMGKFYIINAPWMFATVWSVIKAWLDPVTVAKISIPQGDGRKELLEQIEAENLPSEFGGTCKCVGGCSLSDAGPWNVGKEKAVDGA
ncbi:hypothetical protein BD410DRAFT_796010 [Rickenella mellea]|uniref:CRAL-TRIO domain-containing protein n=1 Tax=Rickenella mellea TaxID=50990 RepID=A0A4Y7PK92_9AGAM|nr:hypothetical protein BD410DRAFT_796010 [Rickenella mellea]